MDGRTIAGLGRRFHSRIRTFFDTPPGADATPLELVQAVLDVLEQQVHPVGRGRRVFPFAAVTVRVLAPESAAAAIAAAFDDLALRTRERLAELRCDAPASLDVDVTCVHEAPPDWSPGQVFAIDYVAPAASTPPRDPAVPSHARSVSITVLAGAAADGAHHTFTEATISIGRTADPTDEQGRLRRNRVAFLDIADGINETVGRAHARLRRDPVSADYRLFDEGSRNGTSILRDGEMIVVHRRDPRGVRVRSGDEIHVGRAVLRIEIR